MATGLGRIGLRVATGARPRVHLRPADLVVIYAFNASGTSAWPPAGFTLAMVRRGAPNTGLQQAFLTSMRRRARRDGDRTGPGQPGRVRGVALSFFGREAISFVVILPIALPGHRHGHGALGTTFASVGFPLGLLTVIVGHATFCVVLVFNNAIARLRRTVAVARGGVGGPRRRPSRRSGT